MSCRGRALLCVKSGVKRCRKHEKDDRAAELSDRRPIQEHRTGLDCRRAFNYPFSEWPRSRVPLCGSAKDELLVVLSRAIPTCGRCLGGGETTIEPTPRGPSTSGDLLIYGERGNHQATVREALRSVLWCRVRTAVLGFATLVYFHFFFMARLHLRYWSRLAKSTGRWRKIWI